MISLAAALLAASVVTTDTLPVDSLRAADDTVRRRPKAVHLSEWYGRRLTIHRTLAYVTLPVFGAQWVAGNQLFQMGSSAPTWAKTGHRVGATTLAGIFTVNTVTGLWNLWDSRSVADHRALRTTHALMMLAADGAFTWAGAKLSNEAENSLEKRRLHRTIALSATGLTVANGLVMKFFNK
ncbi:MAG TPA: hypothetical protein VIV65_06770 [Gemmatimonadaceae bacterium]|jgi:hypothetical protein